MCTTQDMLNVKERIQKGELDGLCEDIREKLLIVAEWMHSNSEANIMEEFDGDVYEKLETAKSNSDANINQREEATAKKDVSTLDDTLKHICEQVGIPIFSRRKLEECGIRTAQDILKVRDRIQNQELDDLHEETREKLLVVAEWMQSHPDANMIEDFDWKVCDELYKAQRWTDQYIGVLGEPNAEDIYLLHKDAAQDDTALQMVVKKASARVMESPYLRSMCGNFDYNHFLDRAVRHFHSLLGQETGASDKTFMVAGRTQSGKSWSKELS